MTSWIKWRLRPSIAIRRTAKCFASLRRLYPRHIPASKIPSFILSHFFPRHKYFVVVFRLLRALLLYLYRHKEAFHVRARIHTALSPLICVFLAR